MKKESKTVNSSALQFTSPDCFAKASKSDEGIVEFSMIAYSGKIIPNHWYWGNIAFDLKGVEIPSIGTPILEEHSLNRKIGIAQKYNIKNNRLDVEKAKLLNNDYAKEFIENSYEGFPYQASIRGKPSVIEFVEKGSDVDVNGYKLSGPGAVWRKWELMESSVCVFGADPNTKSKANQHSEEQIEYFVDGDKFNYEGDRDMPFDLEKFKLENPDGFSEIEQEIRSSVTSEMEDKFSEERIELETKIADMETKIADAQKNEGEYTERLGKMERALIYFKEKEMRLDAESIFSKAFQSSGLETRYSDKIQRLVPYEKFVKEGQLDIEGYKSAVQTELKDWEEFAEKDTPKVQGFGSQKRSPVGDVFTEEDAEKEAEAILATIK